MPATVTAERASIDVDLAVEDVLTGIIASFERVKTATKRIDDGGWTIERTDQRLLIYPKKASDHLFEPFPDDYLTTALPETLAVRVDVTLLPEGGSRVSARLIRRRMPALVGAVALDMFAGLTGIPLASTILHGKNIVSLSSHRRAAKRRLLQLAFEPLLPHQKVAEFGPFRE